MTFKPKKLFTPPTIGLCLDWETSGSNWGGDSTVDYQGLSFGAIIFSTDTFQPIKAMYREIKFDSSKYKWSSESEKIHGLSIEHLEKNGVSQEQAAEDLMFFIVETFLDTPVLFLGHNAEFDIAFTNQLLNTQDCDFGKIASGKREAHIKLHHVVLDTSSLGMILLSQHKSEVLFNAMGITRTEHNALEDAKATLEFARVCREIFQEAL